MNYLASIIAGATAVITASVLPPTLDKLYRDGKIGKRNGINHHHILVNMDEPTILTRSDIDWSGGNITHCNNKNGVDNVQFGANGAPLIRVDGKEERDSLIREWPFKGSVLAGDGMETVKISGNWITLVGDHPKKLPAGQAVVEIKLSV